MRAHCSLLTHLLHQANTPNATQQWKVLIREKCHSPAAIISHMKATAAPVTNSVPYARSNLTSLPMRTTRDSVTLCAEFSGYQESGTLISVSVPRPVPAPVSFQPSAPTYRRSLSHPCVNVSKMQSRGQGGLGPGAQEDSVGPFLFL